MVPQFRHSTGLKNKLMMAQMTKSEECFYDIACFFVGENGDIVKKIVDACDFFATLVIDVLIDKPLMTTTDHNAIIMHDLMLDVGREIVW